MNEKYLTVQEVAERFVTSEKTIQRWLRDGWLHGVKVGRDWRVRAQDVEKVFERDTVGEKDSE